MFKIRLVVFNVEYTVHRNGDDNFINHYRV